jgi:FimV-like protein
MYKSLRSIFSVGMLCWGLATSVSLHAAELGAILNRSFLEQPLNISMQLKLAAGERVNEMHCKVGEPDDFSSLGMSKASFVDDIQCQLQSNKKSSKTAQLKLSSRNPISESVFHLVLVLSSPVDEHQVRDLLLVLDAQPGNDLPVSANTESIPETANETPQAGKPYIVGADETLMNVARQLGLSELEFNQFMLAVLQRNPNAFIHKNIHMLKQGSVLELPTQEEWQSVNRQQAAEEVQQQATMWREYRQQNSEAVQSATQEVPPNATLPADENAFAAPQARDIVRLTNPAVANSKVQGLTVQEEINALRDEIAAHEASIKEANQKTAALEKQIQEMQNLILMKDKSLQQQELLRPWWSKLSKWLASHPWVFILVLLFTMLSFLLAIHQLSKRRAEQALQVMLADIRQTQPDSGAESSVNPQSTADAANVMEKTAQLLQDIDLTLTDSKSASASRLSLVTKTLQSSSVDTQFDLVASYLDMGDQIGASKLLQDIIQNGNDLQQARARKMLSDLK